MKRHLTEEVILESFYTTKKFSMFCSSKDQITTDRRANFIYYFTYFWCKENYIGKADPNIITRLHHHGSCIDQPLHIHLSNCGKFSDIINMMQFPDFDISVVPLKWNKHISYAVMNNFQVVGFCNIWSQLFLSKTNVNKLQPELMKV